MATEQRHRGDHRDVPRRASDRAAAEGARGQPAVHAVGRASVLDLRWLPRGGDRDRRRQARVHGRVRGRGLGEGHARAGRVRADRGAGRDERDERDGERAVKPLADGRARRARAGGTLGDGLAAGDRPRAVRAAADQAGGDARRAPPRYRAWSTRRSAAALAPHFGPAFVDFPMDYVFMEAPEPDEALDGLPARASRGADGAQIERAAQLLGGAERPVIMAGTDLYWGHGESELLELAETLRIPVFLNGLARGCVPADHELFYSRARGAGAEGRGRRAGDRRADGLQAGLRGVVRRGDRDRGDRRGRARAPAPAGGGRGVLRGAGGDAERPARGGRGEGARRASAGWRSCGRPRPSGARPSGWSCEDDRAPLHPMRLYAELARVLERDAIVIGDGGDFVSYAGRVIDSYQPGCWLDPGPFGCLGTGPRVCARGQACAPRATGGAAARETARSGSAGWSSTRSRVTGSTSSA